MTTQEIIVKLAELGITPSSAFNDFDEVEFSGKDGEQLEIIGTLRDKYNWKSEEYKMATKDYTEFYQEALNRALNQIGGVKIVDVVGGGEGEGEHVHVVIYLPAHDIYLKAEATYYSGNGVDYWEEWKEVTPRVVEVIEYD